MQLKFILVSLVALGAAQGKLRRKQAFEDRFERQLIGFDPNTLEMGGGQFNMEDTDDSGELTSGDQKCGLAR